MICSDEEWKKIPESQRKELGLTIDNDGEFYMNFSSDFLRYFGKLEIVHKTPEKMMADQGSEINYEVTYFKGAWDANTAGGCGNDSIGEFNESTYTKYFVISIVSSRQLCQEPPVYVHADRPGHH